MGGQKLHPQKEHKRYGCPGPFLFLWGSSAGLLETQATQTIKCAPGYPAMKLADFTTFDQNTDFETKLSYGIMSVYLQHSAFTSTEPGTYAVGVGLLKGNPNIWATQIISVDGGPYYGSIPDGTELYPGAPLMLSLNLPFFGLEYGTPITTIPSFSVQYG